MRNEFGRVIVELAEKEERIFVLIGDYESGLNSFKKKFPNRLINLGTCEQSLVAVAAGMAIEGFIPIVYSITPFILERPFEQLKITVNQQNIPVVFVGYDDYPNLGITHIALNPKTMMELLTNFHAYYPKKSQELTGIFSEAIHNTSPSFIFLKREPQK